MIQRSLVTEQPFKPFKAFDSSGILVLGASAAGVRRIGELTGLTTAAAEDLGAVSEYSAALVLGLGKCREALLEPVPFKYGLGAYRYVYSNERRVPVFWCASEKECRQNKFVAKYTRELIKELSERINRANSAKLKTTYDVIITEGGAQEAAFDIFVGDWAAFDCETVGQMFTPHFKVIAVSVTTCRMKTYVWDETALADKATRYPLEKWLMSSAPKVGHNLKYDMLAVRCSLGCSVSGVYADTMLQWKLYEGDDKASLDACSYLVGMGGYKKKFYAEVSTACAHIVKYRKCAQTQQLSLFDHEPALQEAIADKGAEPVQHAYGIVDQNAMIDYCAKDTYTTALLMRDIIKHTTTEKPQLGFIWRKVLSRAVPAFCQIEVNGISVDTEGVDEFIEHVSEKLETSRRALSSYGLEKPSSPEAVRSFLFERLGLTFTRKSNKTGLPSTDKATLTVIAQESKEAGELLEFRRLTKLFDAYGNSLKKHIRSDGRVHPEFRLGGTRTGRISCSKPGVHQIPRSSTEEGKKIKDCFVASEGHTLVAADFSQLEIKVAAMLSQDEVMLKQFESGEDFHMQTAKAVAETMWGILPDEVDSTHRTAAKVFVFGLLYAMSDYGLANRLNCSKEKAQKLRRVILGEWRGLHSWAAALQAEANMTGVTGTSWEGRDARIRKLWAMADTGSSNKFTSKTAKNGILNTRVQGSASDFCLASIAAIHEWIQGEKVPAKIVMTVHDSIVVEAEDSHVDVVADKVTSIMEGWPTAGVKLTVDVEVGKRWGSMKPLSRAG